MIEGTEPFVDDSCAALVQWLTTRTLEGRAQWEMHPNGLISHLTGSMFAQFITHTTPQGQVWRLFRVRDNNGELLRTAAPASTIETTPLSVAVEALFLTIVWTGPQLLH